MKNNFHCREKGSTTVHGDYSTGSQAAIDEPGKKIQDMTQKYRIFYYGPCQLKQVPVSRFTSSKPESAKLSTLAYPRRKWQVPVEQNDRQTT
jgi:hypothetical protein